MDESWSVSVEDESLSKAEIRQSVSGAYVLYMHFYKTGDNTVILTDPQGKEYPLIITMDQEKHSQVETP